MGGGINKPVHESLSVRPRSSNLVYQFINVRAIGPVERAVWLCVLHVRRRARTPWGLRGGVRPCRATGVWKGRGVLRRHQVNHIDACWPAQAWTSNFVRRGERAVLAAVSHRLRMAGVRAARRSNQVVYILQCVLLLPALARSGTVSRMCLLVGCPRLGGDQVKKGNPALLSTKAILHACCRCRQLPTIGAGQVDRAQVSALRRGHGINVALKVFCAEEPARFLIVLQRPATGHRRWVWRLWRSKVTGLAIVCGRGLRQSDHGRTSRGYLGGQARLGGRLKSQLPP
mmetsp:Transcript_13584/g.43381  ORF Transcript_13584/g.43381 Transcript_13584/m.43381 type:complete len:286 (+) Transcript_13584:334-1191(+)